MEELKLYEYGIEKPDLSELYLEHLGIDYKNSLMHHGRLRQKWGVRNGPPYPLDSKTVSSEYGGGKLMPSNKDEAPSQKAKKSGGLIQRYKAKKAYKRRVESVNKARQAKQAKAEAAKRAQEEQDSRERAALEKEMWRQDVINRGDAKAASEHTDDFSKEEIERIIGKYQANQRLSQLVSETNVPMNPPPNTTEVQKSRWEKMGNKISEINKFAGPMSELARNASSMYDLYSKVSKDKQAKDNEQYKRQKEAEETRYKRQKEAEETKYRREQDALDRKERYDLHITKEEQNKAKAQQNNQQNQQKQQQNKNDVKKVVGPSKTFKITRDELNNLSFDKLEKMYFGDQKDEKSKRSQSTPSQSKKDQPKKEEKEFLYSNGPEGQKWRVPKSKIANSKNNVKDSKEKSSESMKKSISNLATNPNTQGALAQLTRDLTKNTKMTSGQPLRISGNEEWLAKQSTEVLKLMKKNIDKKDNPSAKVTIQDINNILKKRK